MTAGRSIKRNIAFNVVGGIWAIILNLLAVRFQLNFLGSEAYGLISFGASLQLFFSLFEMGISTLIIREVAKDTSPDFHMSRTLIQTAIVIFWTVAVTLGIIIFLSSNWLVTHWITLDHISSTDAAFVVRVWAIALVFNHPMALYYGLMAGMQRLDIGNLVKSGVVTTYLGGGIVLLLLTHSMTLYMIWNAATSIGGVVIYAVMAQRLMKDVSLRPRFSLAAVRGVWRSSLQLGLIAVFTMVFMQSDRIFISRLLPVKQLGYYAAAYTIITGITLLQGFVISAVMPALAADFGRGDLVTMRARYYKTVQILVYIVGLLAFVCIFFGHDLLLIWTTPETADGAYRTLGLLAFGSLLNAAVSAGYTVCVVTDNIRFATLVNVAAIWLYWPILYGLIQLFGIEGAALTWVFINFYYVATFAIVVQRYILKDRLMVWFTRTLIPFFVLGFIFLIGYLLAQQFDNLFLRELIYFANVVIYLVLGFGLLDQSVKDSIIRPVLQFTATLRNNHDT